MRHRNPRLLMLALAGAGAVAGLAMLLGWIVRRRKEQDELVRRNRWPDEEEIKEKEKIASVRRALGRESER